MKNNKLCGVMREYIERNREGVTISPIGLHGPITSSNSKSIKKYDVWEKYRTSCLRKRIKASSHYATLSLIEVLLKHIEKSGAPIKIAICNDIIMIEVGHPDFVSVSEYDHMTAAQIDQIIIDIMGGQAHYSEQNDFNISDRAKEIRDQLNVGYTNDETSWR